MSLFAPGPGLTPESESRAELFGYGNMRLCMRCLVKYIYYYCVSVCQIERFSVKVSPGVSFIR